MSTVKAVVYDADGVLIQSERFSDILAREYGITPERTLPFFTGPFTQCITGKADLKEVIKPYIVSWGWKKSVDEFLEYWFRSEHKINHPLVEHSNTLKNKGIVCAIATNQEQYRAQYVLEQMEFGTLFDHVFISAYMGTKKPDASFFTSMTAELSPLIAEETLFWDDTQENVDAAIQLGIKAYLYTDFVQYTSRTESYIFSS